MAVSCTVESRPYVEGTSFSDYVGGYFDCQGKAHFLWYLGYEYSFIRDDLARVEAPFTADGLSGRSVLGVDAVTGILHVKQPCDFAPYLQFDFRKEQQLTAPCWLPRQLSRRINSVVVTSLCQNTSLRRTQSFLVYTQVIRLKDPPNVQHVYRNDYMRVVAVPVATATAKPVQQVVFQLDNGKGLTEFAGCYETLAGSLRLCVWRRQTVTHKCSHVDVCAFDDPNFVIRGIPLPFELDPYGVQVLEWLSGGALMVLGTKATGDPGEVPSSRLHIWTFNTCEESWSLTAAIPKVILSRRCISIFDPCQDVVAIKVWKQGHAKVVYARGPGRRMAWAVAVRAALLSMTK